MALSLLYANDKRGEHAPSWYAASAEKFPTLPALEGSRKFDVAVVGAGYSGLSSALHLVQLGFKVCVLDAHRVGWGASGRNGGQVGSGQRVDQDELEKLVGDNLAHEAFAIGIEAAQTVRKLIKKHKINCAYRDGVMHVFHRERFNKYGVEEVEHLKRKYDYHSVSYLSKEETREKVGSADYHGGVLDTAAGHLHPLNYARGLANAAMKLGVEIFEMSEVTEVTGGKPAHLKTANGDISANHIILACNGYLGALDGQVANRVMPINNFVIATEPLGKDRAKSIIRDGEAVADSRFVVNYFRLSEDNRMLFGGGENYSYRFPRDIKNFVRPYMLKIFPQLKDAKIDYGWGGTLAITFNRLPHFEFRKDGILNISGYSGSGVAMATMAGKIAAEAVHGHMAQFDVMSALPTPKFPGGAALRWPLLPLAMTWYSLRDRF